MTANTMSLGVEPDTLSGYPRPYYPASGQTHIAMWDEPETFSHWMFDLQAYVVGIVGDQTLPLDDNTPQVSTANDDHDLTREQARERLLAAGLLSTIHRAPEDAVPLTPEQRAELGRVPEGARDSSELIDEERGEY